MGADLTRQVALYKRLDLKRSQSTLDAEEERQWQALKDVLERASAGADLPPSSRRRDLRVPTQLEVSFSDARGFARAYLRNISEGGVYVETSHAFKMRDRFDLTIIVQAPASQIELQVEVVWVNRTPSPGSGLEPGVGVAFLNLPPDRKALIKGLVHRALDDLAGRGSTP